MKVSVDKKYPLILGATYVYNDRTLPLRAQSAVLESCDLNADRIRLKDPHSPWVFESNYATFTHYWTLRRSDEVSCDSPYFLEFVDDHVTLYRRNWILPKHQFEEMAAEHPLMSNEGHPLNIFTVKVSPAGCIPDRSWFEHMVRKLNHQTVNF